VLLSPVSGRLVADLVCGKTLADAARAFLPERFSLGDAHGPARDARDRRLER
jgi:glycine/D-amino acid oxidase-like deaminating enzyme